MTDEFDDFDDVDEPHVVLSTDGKGKWLRREWKPQCPESVFILDKCQGVEGHEGGHWCFTESGSYSWSVNRDRELKGHEIAASMTPPDHDNYRTPLEMQEHYYMNHFTDSEVTDPGEIARLERGEMKCGESIDRPVSPKELENFDIDENWLDQP